MTTFPPDIRNKVWFSYNQITRFFALRVVITTSHVLPACCYIFLNPTVWITGGVLIVPLISTLAVCFMLSLGSFAYSYH